MFAIHLAKRWFYPVVDESISVGFIYTQKVDIFVSMSNFHIKIISLFKIILIIHIYKFMHKSESALHSNPMVAVHSLKQMFQMYLRKVGGSKEVFLGLICTSTLKYWMQDYPEQPWMHVTTWDTLRKWVTHFVSAFLFFKSGQNCWKAEGKQKRVVITSGSLLFMAELSPRSVALLLMERYIKENLVLVTGQIGGGLFGQTSLAELCWPACVSPMSGVPGPLQNHPHTNIIL